MHFAKIALISAYASTFVIGCNNPKTANEGNFTKAINQVLPKSGHNCFGVGELPHITDKNENPRMFEKLVKIGLLSKSDKSVKTSGNTHISTYYNLTSEGKKIRKIKLSPFSFNTINLFCIGDLEVDKIVNFTEPQNESGTVVSEVKYTYKLTNIPKWAQDSELQKLIPSLVTVIQMTKRQNESKIKLMLTDKGWVRRTNNNGF
ncbi:MAG: hypothetical protein WBA41_03070 [Rivularia sp. (in: cyanobacteria)]